MDFPIQRKFKSEVITKTDKKYDATQILVRNSLLTIKHADNFTAAICDEKERCLFIKENFVMCFMTRKISKIEKH